MLSSFIKWERKQPYRNPLSPRHRVLLPKSETLKGFVRVKLDLPTVRGPGSFLLFFFFDDLLLFDVHQCFAYMSLCVRVLDLTDTCELPRRAGSSKGAAAIIIITTTTILLLTLFFLNYFLFSIHPDCSFSSLHYSHLLITPPTSPLF